MKRKVKKILRFFLLFLSSFALVLYCLPVTALANEYNGNTYAVNDNYSFNDDLLITWAAQKVELLGYDLSGDVSNYNSNIINAFLQYGIDLSNANGLINADLGEYGQVDVEGALIDYSNSDIQDLLNRVKDFEYHDQDYELINNFQNIFLPGLDDLWDFQYFDLFPSADDAELMKMSESAERNLNKYFSYKYYGALRGSRESVPSVTVSSDNWANAQDIFVTYFRPEFFAAYDDPSTGGYLFLNGYANDFYLGSGSYDYSVSPYDIWGISGNGSYINGTFDINCNITQTDFNLDESLTRFNVRLDNLYNKSEIAVFSPDLVRIQPLSNCSVRDTYVITPDDSNNGDINFYVYVSSVDTEVKLYTENFYSGGVTAPETPIFEVPDPSSPTYETDKAIYDYVVTETDRLLDIYDIDTFMSDVLETFDDTPWLFYPIQFYNEVAEVLTENYSDTFDFTLEEMNFSFIADGFFIPHKEFHFDPDTLPTVVKSLFRMFQWILTFGYFWALIMWGRSLILRFGSDSTHIDYEDN